MLHGTLTVNVRFKCETQDELDDLKTNLTGACEKQAGVEDAEICDEDVNDTADETNE